MYTSIIDILGVKEAGIKVGFCSKFTTVWQALDLKNYEWNLQNDSLVSLSSAIPTVLCVVLNPAPENRGTFRIAGNCFWREKIHGIQRPLCTAWTEVPWASEKGRGLTPTHIVKSYSKSIRSTWGKLCGIGLDFCLFKLCWYNKKSVQFSSKLFLNIYFIPQGSFMLKVLPNFHKLLGKGQRGIF